MRPRLAGLAPRGDRPRLIESSATATDRQGRSASSARPARDATCPYAGPHLRGVRPELPRGRARPHPVGPPQRRRPGHGRLRVIPPGTRAARLRRHRDRRPGRDRRPQHLSERPVVEKGDNLKPADEDGAYFPCMIAAQIHVDIGDSGGAVLVRGIPAGVTSRSFGGWLGFTPLAEGLAERLELCSRPLRWPAVADRWRSVERAPSTASANTAVWRSTSASVVAGRHQRHVVERRHQDAAVHRLEVEEALEVGVGVRPLLGAVPRRCRAGSGTRRGAQPRHVPRDVAGARGRRRRRPPSARRAGSSARTPRR